MAIFSIKSLGIYAVTNVPNPSMSQGCASICGTKNVPNLLTTWHTIQGHPCMGVLRLMTLNFGGGAGGKSSTRGIFTASSGVSIRQCWRMFLRFVVYNLI